MWYRLLRALNALFNAYSFYRNPKGFILSILSAVGIGLLLYLFGGLILFVVAVVAAVLLFRKARSSERSARY